MTGAVAPLLITQASADSRFKDHPAPELYGIESYIAVPLLRRDGSVFGVLCALDPLPSKLTEDVFELFHLLAGLIAYELEEDERQQQRDAEIRALEDFIAIAAHDLRQPLTALSARAQLLSRRVRRGIAPTILADSIDALVADVLRTTQLSDALLDVAHIERHGLQLDICPVDLVALAHAALRDAQSTSPLHDFRLSAPLALEAYLDERRIGQVLRNLLDNAAKYAPNTAGPVVLALDPPDKATGNPDIGISVRDNGPGVSIADLQQLFERRYRSSTAVASQIAGSGLGLFIAREIVAAHGGSIAATVPDGGGLLVRIDLPHRLSPEATAGESVRLDAEHAAHCGVENVA